MISKLSYDFDSSEWLDSEAFMRYAMTLPIDEQVRVTFAAYEREQTSGKLQSEARFQMAKDAKKVLANIALTGNRHLKEPVQELLDYCLTLNGEWVTSQDYSRAVAWRTLSEIVGMVGEGVLDRDYLPELVLAMIEVFEKAKKELRL